MQNRKPAMEAALDSLNRGWVMLAAVGRMQPPVLGPGAWHGTVKVSTVDVPGAVQPV